MSDCPHDTRGHGPIPGDVQTQRQPQEPDREALLDELADCMAQAEDDSDVARIEALIRELEQFGELAPGIDPEQSLKEFHEKYDVPAPPAPSSPSAVPRRRRSRQLRYMAGVAIIASLLLAFVIVSGAGGSGLIGTIASWSNSTFHIEWPGWTPEQGPGPQDSAEIEYDSLQEALDAYGIEEQLAPSRLPDEAVLKKLSVFEEQNILMFTALYQLPNGDLSISFRQGEVLPSSEVEKDDETVEFYTMAGIEHKLMQDINRFKAVWNNGPWECRITGEINRDEMITMIDSIYK